MFTGKLIALKTLEKKKKNWKVIIYIISNQEKSDSTLKDIREINEIRNELAKADASSLKRLLKLINPFLARLSKRNREEAHISPEMEKWNHYPSNKLYKGKRVPWKTLWQFKM